VNFLLDQVRQSAYVSQWRGSITNHLCHNTTARVQTRSWYAIPFVSSIFAPLIEILQDNGVPNTDLPTTVASSSGPQRSKRGATRKGKEIEKGTGRRKRAYKKTLPPGINWNRTCDRLYWEMIQTYLLQPSGGLPTPRSVISSKKTFTNQ